ncbi:hypothetical protein ACI6PS_03445 [Flavobacterium sp. PLA-1-15]|uniref:hypothetical protein n=1 Tax=Flavobacterium sp. PLA-1-15 TaxID=3380533 RepID=UPI003B81170E
MKLKEDLNNYSLTSRKSFVGIPVDEAIIGQSFEFAYEMAYGEGFHRNCRSGGQSSRSKSEIFQNTFQGKMAEGILYENLKKQGIETEMPDFSIHGKGIWDDADLKANGKTICIKSAAFFSNLLLLETKDWDSEGHYIPNITHQDASHSYDYFVLVRIKPDIKLVLKDGVDDKGVLLQKIKAETWLYDVPGCCSIKTIQHIIANECVLPQNAMLNGKTKMDASNYYIQAGLLFPIELLYEALHKI